VKKYIKIGIILLIVILCGACKNLKDLDKQAKIYVDKALPKIISQWDSSELTNHGHPDLMKSITFSQLEQQFFLFKKLGPLEEYQNSEGQIVLSKTSGGLKIISGDYVAKAKFENGSATISVRVINENKEWSIISFQVYSDSLKKAPPLENKTIAESNITNVPNKIELEALVNDLIQKNDTIAISKNIENVFQLAEIYQDDGLDEKAIRLYSCGLTADPTNFEYHIKLSELLIKNNRGKETISRLLNVYNLVEDEQLFQKTKKLLINMNADLPRIDDPKPADERFEIQLISLGDVSNQVVSELRVALQNKMEMKVSISQQSVPIGEPDRIYADKYISELYKNVTGNLTLLQRNMLLSELGLKDEELSSCSNQSRFIIVYFNKLGTAGEIELQNFNSVLTRLGSKGQYDSNRIAEEMRRIFPFGKSRSLKAYIGVTSMDLYCENCNFLYGSTNGSYGVISYSGFAAINTQEKQNRPRLIRRLLKQCLSSANFALGIPRCDTPLCARSYPNNLEEQDAKSEDLCSICKNRLDDYKKSLCSNTAAFEFLFIGNNHLNKGELDKALNAYETSNKCDSKYIPAYLGLCDIYSKKQMYDKVLWAASEAIAADPAAYRAYAYQGKAYEHQGINEKAKWAYNKALELVPVDKMKEEAGPILNCLGSLYLSMGDKELGTKCFAKAVNTDPEDPQSNYNLGFAKYRSGHFDKAIPHLEIGATHAQGSYVASSLSCIGSCYSRMGKYEQAIEYFEKSLKINPNSDDTHYNLGFAFKNVGKKNSAILHYEKSVEINPSLFEGHAALGRIYGENNMLVSSIKSFRAALSIKPDYAVGWNDLGYTYFLKKIYSTAIKHYEKAISLSPGLAIAHYNKSLAHYALKEFDSAISEYDRASELGYPGSSHFRNNLSQYRRKN